MTRLVSCCCFLVSGRKNRPDLSCFFQRFFHRSWARAVSALRGRPSKGGPQQGPILTGDPEDSRSATGEGRHGAGPEGGRASVCPGLPVSRTGRALRSGQASFSAGLAGGPPAPW